MLEKPNAAKESLPFGKNVNRGINRLHVDADWKQSELSAMPF